MCTQWVTLPSLHSQRGIPSSYTMTTSPVFTFLLGECQRCLNEDTAPKRCTFIRNSFGSAFVSPPSHQRKRRNSLSPGLTWNLWNIFSTSQMTATECLRNLQRAPVIPLASSGPISKWSFSAVLSYLAEQSNTTLILFGYFGWQTPWCGIYTSPATSSFSALSTSPSLNRPSMNWM